MSYNMLNKPLQGAHEYLLTAILYSVFNEPLHSVNEFIYQQPFYIVCSMNHYIVLMSLSINSHSIKCVQ